MVIEGKVSVTFEDPEDEEELQCTEEAQVGEEEAPRPKKKRVKHAQHLKQGGLFGEGCIVDLFKLQAAEETNEHNPGPPQQYQLTDSMGDVNVCAVC
eukprot:COSAG05_NODE_101_length_19100_cov_24.260144_12_plen_97_part_00